MSIQKIIDDYKKIKHIYNEKVSLDEHAPALMKLFADEKIVYCGDCKKKYFKDMQAYCPERVHPLSVSGFCEKGRKE